MKVYQVLVSSSAWQRAVAWSQNVRAFFGVSNTKVHAFEARDVILDELQVWMNRFGFWPEQEPLNMRAVINSASGVCFFIGPSLLFMARSSDFVIFCVAVCETIGVGMFEFQLLVYSLNNERLRGIIEDLREFLKKSLLSGVDEWKSFHREFNHKLTMFTRIIISLFMIEGFSYIFGEGLILQIAKLCGKNVNVYSYGMHLDFYFEGFSSDWRYFTPMFVTVGVYFHFFVVSYCLMGFFGAQLIMTVITCFKFIEMQIQDLGRRVREKTPGLDVQEVLKDIAANHAEAVRITLSVNECLKGIFLVKFLLNILFLCLMMFMLLIEFNVVMIIRLFLFLILLFAENTGLFYIADKLTDQAGRLSFAIYDIEWYDQPKPVKDMIRLMMVHAQKPVALTAGQFYDVTIYKYGQHLQAAYNYYNVLRQTVAK